MKPFLAVDVETKLIARGIDAAPELVSVSFCDENFDPQLLLHSEAEEAIADAFRNYTVVGANFGFDACVLMRRFPNLIPIIYEAYSEGRVQDVQLAQKLIDLGQGQLNGYRHVSGEHIKILYNLAALYERYGLGLLTKGPDTWRLRYGELINTPIAQWPAEASEYAKKDALATLQIWLQQQHFAEYLLDLPAQTRKALELYKMTWRGIITDGPTCDKYYQEVVDDIARCEKELTKAGIVRAGKGSRDTKAAKAYMRRVCEELDLEPKLTPAGLARKKAGAGREELWNYISLDAEATRDTGDPLLGMYSTLTSAKTILNKAATLKEGSKGLPLQCEFDVLKETGRVSSRVGKILTGIQLQNLPREGLMRNCLVARPGYALISVDFVGHELIAVAQCQTWFTGKSKLADALNTGRDIHCDVGALLLGCSYEEILENKKVGKYKLARQQSKEVNFGGFGVLSAKRLAQQMNRKREKDEPIIDLPRAQQIMRAWAARWEAESYFDAVGALFPEQNRWGLATIKQFVSGRIRANIDFPTACNSFFSGLAADSSAAGFVALGRACALATRSDPLYDTHLLFPVHDEIVFEVPLDRLHEAATSGCSVFLEAARAFFPDVRLEAEPAAMFAYHKDAAPVYSNGELQIWQP